MYSTDSLIKFWFNLNRFQTINSIVSYTILYCTYYYGQFCLYENVSRILLMRVFSFFFHL